MDDTSDQAVVSPAWNDRETRAIARGAGKWGDPNVPKTGWEWTDDEPIDHGEPVMRCEMCEYMHIRYEHTMSHPHYPTTLGCGCICAGHMSGDMRLAQDRQRRAVNRTKNAKAKAQRAARRAEEERQREIEHEIWAAQVQAERAARQQREIERRNAMTQDQRDDETLQDAIEKLNLIWRTSASGNWWAKAPGGWRITVYTDHKRGGWKFMFVFGDDDPVWHHQRFEDAKQAKETATRVFATIAMDAAKKRSVNLMT